MNANNNLVRFQKETGLELIGTTTVWNFHGIDHLVSVGMNKQSNLHAELKHIYKEYDGIITVFVSQIGRSAHSATIVGIYKGATNLENCSYYYSKRCDEFTAKDFKTNNGENNE